MFSRWHNDCPGYQEYQRRAGATVVRAVEPMLQATKGTRTLLLRSLSPALIKPLMIVGGIVGAMLVIALLTLVVTSWRARMLTEPVQAHVHQLSEIRDVASATQRLLVRNLSNPSPASPAEISSLRAKLGGLIKRDNYLDPNTPLELATARNELSGFQTEPRAALAAALSSFQKILDREWSAQTRLIEEMHAYARWENRIAIASLVGLPLLAVLAFFALRGRILNSLNHISELIERLGGTEFTPAAITGSDPELRSVLESYNKLVSRLAAAEAENVRRRDDLEAQVRAATGTVLRQGRELADADRLAAVGETSARIAHELRNPLAGIELGLRNVLVDCDSSGRPLTDGLHERLEPMISELQRMSRLLTDLLDQGRRAPERPAEMDVGACIRETVSLVRYQTPKNVSIDTEIGDGISCFLPRDTLRQVVFNLVLNAIQVIGEQTGAVIVHGQSLGDELVLRIIDDGPGFPEEVLALGPRIFATRRAGGVGLGLSTVGRLTEQMGGHMELTNRTQGGAVVSLTLPCRISHA
jgi:two-component system, NtrC family, sensor kinase